MKFLEYTPLDSINNFLSHVDLGDCVLKGKLEAYSCKHAGMDRKLSFSLEQEILDYLAQSLEISPPSSTNLLSSRTSRKTLIYLILTLNHMYPDYDFSAVQTHHFFREEGWDNFKQMYETYMLEAEKEWALNNEGDSLLECMLRAIDEVIKLAECEVYSYSPDIEGDPFLQRGAVWSVNFFFYNRKLKRILSFRCCCTSKLNMDDWLADEVPNGYDVVDNGDLFYDMDM
ncbi:Repressor of RNA polymerase III transcription MAF1-like protein [Nymphaea thermarum]|nr:Repressor of RNA polymerase III transcription MAF1-like protein [Nymphaea thermarum]